MLNSGKVLIRANGAIGGRIKTMRKSCSITQDSVSPQRLAATPSCTQHQAARSASPQRLAAAPSCTQHQAARSTKLQATLSRSAKLHAAPQIAT